MNQQKAVATPGTPEYRKSARAGNAAADQIRNREGPAYERWVAGMNAAVERHKHMMHKQTG